MTQVFFWLSVGLAVLMCIGAIWLGKFDNKIRSAVQRLLIMAGITILFNGCAVAERDLDTARLYYGLYLCFVDWLVVTLLVFAERYTESFKGNLLAKMVIYGSIIADNISMLVNYKEKHVFDVRMDVLFNSQICSVMTKHTSYYTMHLIIAYSIVLLVMMAVIHKTFSTVKLYRKKYESIAVSFAVILAANIIYRFINIIPVDFSCLLYGLLGICAAYYSMFYIPKGLVVKLLSFSVSDLGSGIICFDRDGRCVYINETARKLTRLGQKNVELEEFFHHMDIRTELNFTGERTWSGEWLTDDRKVYIEVLYRPLLDEKGNSIGCYFSVYDKTDDVEKLDKEIYRATHDPLTGIYNRNRFFERVSEVIKAAPDTERCIIVFDIKEFKLINDLFGEKHGDDILIRIGDMLLERVHESDDSVCGRLTGDRFALCINRENYSEDMLQRFADDVEETTKNSVYKMHMHIGVYLVSDNSVKISVMCDRALLAIRKIKDSYQQTIAYFDDDMNEALHRQSMLLSEFDTAILQKQFMMYLQPQVSADGRQMIGAEALVRWKHPLRGMIPPGVFVADFERTGHIFKLDRFIWEEACIQLKEWERIGREDLYISVNISPKDFYYIDIYKTFTELVEKYDIDPHRLNLEITESAIMSNLQATIPMLDALRSYGFHVELDDFGSGYSSLNTLKDIEVDVVKLDMGFLAKTDKDDKSRIIMDSVITMAKQLGLTIVAEGVENVEQADYLAGKGCDIFQGYYFSRPISVGEFEEKYHIKDRVNL